VESKLAVLHLHHTGEPSVTIRVHEVHFSLIAQMKICWPNELAAPSGRLRLGPVPWSFGFSKRQGSAVGELSR
jgi:hypothetical protein